MEGADEGAGLSLPGVRASPRVHWHHPQPTRPPFLIAGHECVVCVCACMCSACVCVRVAADGWSEVVVWANSLSHSGGVAPCSTPCSGVALCVHFAEVCAVSLEVFTCACAPTSFCSIVFVCLLLCHPLLPNWACCAAARRHMRCRWHGQFSHGCAHPLSLDLASFSISL
jgi:hypothetical protein